MDQPNGQQITFPLDPASVQILVQALTPYFGAALVSQIVAGVGITVSPSDGQGTVTITNAGVASLIAGAGISISGSTGNITISATTAGVTQIIAGTGISISPSGGTGAVTITAIGGSFSGVFNSGGNAWNTTNPNGNQVIAHGLGVTPLFVRVTAYSNATGGTGVNIGSVGTWSTPGGNNDVWFGFSGGGSSTFGRDGVIISSLQSAGTTESKASVSSVDATNITLAWVKTGSPNVTVQYMWEAWG